MNNPKILELKTVRIKIKRNCLKCSEPIITHITRVFSNDRLLRVDYGKRLCKGCNQANKRVRSPRRVSKPARKVTCRGGN